MKDSYIVFEIQGDQAKNITATAVARALHKAYPDRKIIVVTGSPEVWLHNPHVYRFYALGGMAYFYDDYIKDKDTLILRHDPAQTEDFAYARKPLAHIWCNLFNIPHDGERIDLFFTWREEEAVTKILDEGIQYSFNPRQALCAAKLKALI